MGGRGGRKGKELFFPGSRRGGVGVLWYRTGIVPYRKQETGNRYCTAQHCGLTSGRGTHNEHAVRQRVRQRVFGFQISLS